MLTVTAVLLLAAPATAQESDRVVEFSFVPTRRAQIAIWIERADGTFMDTVRLTQSVSYRGVGNRPGAMTMNGGFRWPYGRREGTLPVWAHRRAAAPGAEQFRRVIFQDRVSEGYASRTTNDFSRDDYYCLSFNAETTRREALDAVSCASIFNSDKGRFITEADVDSGYAEPYEAPGTSTMRALSFESLYPPRRDVSRCRTAGCSDHTDVSIFDAEARRVMPRIDVVTMATPPGDTFRTVAYDVPSHWPTGDYVAFLEINVEGDYNGTFNDQTYPTPMGPDGGWDYWAQQYGYAYRGQPSVVFQAPFQLGSAGETSVVEPGGYGHIDGMSGDMTPMGGAISNDPTARPGSGADRLRLMRDGTRFGVRVVATNVCTGERPPPECGAACSPENPCPEGFLCAGDATCIGYCDAQVEPDAPEQMRVLPHDDEKHSHEWARLSFRVPESLREISRYEIRTSTTPILDEESFLRATPAFAADLDTHDVVVDITGQPGDLVELELGQLIWETTYYIAVRAVDECNDPGPIEVQEVTTTAINFTTVSPCFVATAAWGSPLAKEIGSLRRMRDRHLLTNSLGTAAVAAYHEVGPYAADLIRHSPLLRAGARAALRPWVALAELLDGERSES